MSTRAQLVLRLRAAAKDLWQWTTAFTPPRDDVSYDDCVALREKALESLGDLADEFGTGELQLDPDTWVVWSIEHSAWWGPDRHGYFVDLLCAGIYTEADARDIERRANQYRDASSPNERATTLVDAIAMATVGLPFMRPSGECVIDVLHRSLAAPDPAEPGAARG